MASSNDPIIVGPVDEIIVGPSEGESSSNIMSGMSIEFFKTLIASKHIIAIYFDNDQVWTFDDGTEELTEDNFEVVGGIEMIKRLRYTHSLDTKKGISSCDIPIWEYKPVDIIQGIYILDNEQDLKRIDPYRSIYTT